MKIILEAFGGKLRSDPMDWPESSSSSVLLRMDFDEFEGGFTMGTNEPMLAQSHRTARFIATGRYLVCGRTNTAQIYKLVDVSSK